MHEQIADLINKTRSNELESKPSTSTSVNSIAMTTEDIDNLLSVTRNDPSFDDILRDLVDKFHDPAKDLRSPSSSEKLSEEALVEIPAEEVPIKQRLRQRVESKASPVPAGKKEKIKIISDEPYTGIIPAVANFNPQLNETHQVLMTVPQVFMQSGLELIQIVENVPQASNLLPNMQALMSPGSAAHQYAVQTVVQPSLPVMATLPPITSLTKGITIRINEKKQITPKVVLHPSFVKSASRSTPRHVRTLDFNQTPSHRPSTLVECKTPLSRIPVKTPGSAPALMGTAPTKILPTVEVETILEIDDNSNSNPIQNTPKVVKNRRRRKIAEVKSEPKSEEKKLEQPLVNASDEWAMVRSQARLPVDELMRLQYEKAEKKASPKKRKTALKRTAPSTRKHNKTVLASKNKSSSHSPEEEPKNKEDNSTEYDENQPLSSMKNSSANKCPIKITSPRKAMKNTPKKKKKKPTGGKYGRGNGAGKESVIKPAVTELPAASGDPDVVTECNRSDKVQEVATALLDLSSGVKENGLTTSEAVDDTKTQTDSGLVQNLLLETPFKGLLETPLKTDSLTPLPNTPQFAVPIMSHAQETPVAKIFASCYQTTTFTSIIKTCDIPTPSFAITPGSKKTPPKDGLEASPNSGYCSRRTDYSSGSSYYKPDECDEININAIMNQRKSERQSQSESDGGVSDQRSLRVPVSGSVKKVECPGAIERVKSFTEEQSKVPTLHYQMMEDGLLSESIVQTATDDSNVSSSTCTTCSTCSSTCSSSSQEKALNKKLDDASKNDDKDSEWEPDNLEERTVKISPAVNQATGEVRFPLRNWITPKKVDVDAQQARIDETNRIKSLLSVPEPPRLPSIEEEHRRRMAEMEATKKRTLEKIKRDSNAAQEKNLPKFKKTNVKNFKLPAQTLLKPAFVSRKEQILQQQLTERSRPTPLKLIPSSSSRRKSATPRKTIVIDELPRQPSPIKKKRAKLDVSSKSPEKTNRLSLESLPDNAVMSVEPVFHNLSSSFTSNDEETARTVVEKVQQIVIDDGSNTFQKILIAQGFHKNDAVVLQHELVDKLEKTPPLTANESDQPEVPAEPVRAVAPPLPPESPVTEQPPEPSSVDGHVVAKDLEMTNETMEQDLSDISSSGSSDESEDEEYELQVFSAAENEKNSRSFTEPANFKPFAPSLHHREILKTVLRIDGRTITLQDSGLFDNFSIESKMSVKLKKPKKQSPKKTADEKKNGKDAEEKKNGKDAPAKNGKPKLSKEPPKVTATTSAKSKT